MTLRPLYLSSVALLLLACSSADKKTPAPPAGAEMAMQMPTPGPEHEHLLKGVGRWKAVASMMGQESKGTLVVEPGPGRFTVFTRYEAEDMGGMPFSGRGVDSYDPSRGKYVSVWTDSWSPMMVVLEGSWDAASRTMTMHGQMADMTGAMTPHTLVTKWIDDDTMLFSILPGGSSEPSMTIRYERK